MLANSVLIVFMPDNWLCWATRSPGRPLNICGNRRKCIDKSSRSWYVSIECGRRWWRPSGMWRVLCLARARRCLAKRRRWHALSPWKRSSLNTTTINWDKLWSDRMLTRYRRMIHGLGAYDWTIFVSIVWTILFFEQYDKHWSYCSKNVLKCSSLPRIVHGHNVIFPQFMDVKRSSFIYDTWFECTFRRNCWRRSQSSATKSRSITTPASIGVRSKHHFTQRSLKLLKSDAKRQ